MRTRYPYTGRWDTFCPKYTWIFFANCNCPGTANLVELEQNKVKTYISEEYATVINPLHSKNKTANCQRCNFFAQRQQQLGSIRDTSFVYFHMCFTYKPNLYQIEAWNVPFGLSKATDSESYLAAQRGQPA
jgi:hypothetical protein